MAKVEYMMKCAKEVSTYILLFGTMTTFDKGSFYFPNE